MPRWPCCREYFGIGVDCRRDFQGDGYSVKLERYGIHKRLVLRAVRVAAGHPEAIHMSEKSPSWTRPAGRATNGSLENVAFALAAML